MKERNITFQYASIFSRFLALFVDTFIIFFFVSSVLLIHYLLSFDQRLVTLVLGNGIIFLFLALYFIILPVIQNGQTLGKKVMGLKIIRQDSQKINFSISILRFFGTLISGIVLGIGYLSALFNHQKLTWHDRISKTYVICVDNQKRTGLKILLGFFACTIMIVYILGAIFTYFETKNPQLIDYGPPVGTSNHN